MYICGIDEAGRGPLAGPVVAAAVILPDSFPVELLNDSKKISKSKRFYISKIIRNKAINFGVGFSWPEEIDKYNIHCATLLAMKRAYAYLNIKPDLVQVDGLFAPKLDTRTETYVRGDTYIPSIQAASIIAKTARDLLMERLSWIYTDYHFENNVGYPTLEHRLIIKKKGLSPVHRKSFKVTFPR